MWTMPYLTVTLPAIALGAVSIAALVYSWRTRPWKKPD